MNSGVVSDFEVRCRGPYRPEANFVITTLA